LIQRNFLHHFATKGRQSLVKKQQRRDIMTKVQLRGIIGENIRRERITRDISIDELGDMLSLTSGFVGLIERGQRGATPVTLFKLSAIFGIPIDTFFYKMPEPSTKLAEIPASQVKREKLASLTADFSDAELDFVISSVKGLRGIYRSKNASDFDDEDDDDN